jgi:hypothetical protein
MFGWGVFFGPLGMGCRYLAQSHYGQSLNEEINFIMENLRNKNRPSVPESKYKKRGRRWEMASFASTAIAYILFGIGLNEAVSAFVCYIR